MVCRACSPRWRWSSPCPLAVAAGSSGRRCFLGPRKRRVGGREPRGNRQLHGNRSACSGGGSWAEALFGAERGEAPGRPPAASAAACVAALALAVLVVRVGQVGVRVEFAGRNFDADLGHLEDVGGGEGGRRPVVVAASAGEHGEADAAVLQDDVAADGGTARYSRSLSIRSVRPEVGLSTSKTTTTPGMTRSAPGPPVQVTRASG